MRMPFGKWRGYPVSAIVQRDPQYCRWLCEQAWFVAKFRQLHAGIIGGNHTADAEAGIEDHRVQPSADRGPARSGGRVIYAVDRFGVKAATDSARQEQRRQLARDRQRRARARKARAADDAGPASPSAATEGSRI